MRAPRINKSPKAGEAIKQKPQNDDIELDSPIAIDREGENTPPKQNPTPSLRHSFILCSPCRNMPEQKRRLRW